MILSQLELLDAVGRGLISRKSGLEPVVDLTSIGLHLGSVFLKYQETVTPARLPSSLQTEPVAVDGDGFVHFPPGACLLASTEETIEMPLDIMGFIQTKGTIARGFVTVHLCDGQIDPGYKGSITLELVNLSRIRYLLRPGTPIAQLFLHKLSTPLKAGYAGRYQAATGPTSMRLE